MAPDASHSEHLTAILGPEAEALIDLNQTLTSLRIENTIKLPSIVVLGDQSTGKSSLIEKISKIKVPKAAGLCTRTPIRIQLSSAKSANKEWECSVHIEENYKYDTASRNKRISKTNPFGPWQPVPEPSTTLIETTQDRSKLLDLIQVAQNLILDPTRKQGSIESSIDGLERFSPNVILINISFGDCPNLSFVDLPGVIQVSERGQPEYYTRLVENLARQWARDENTCVLLVLPMVHDVSNSKSYAIVQSEDAQSHTIAVFTKPDLAQEQQREEYLAKYFGEENEEEFEHGHFTVMLQGAMDSTDDGRAAEATFFSQRPWSALPSTARDRFGVDKLTALLRKMLFQKTNDALPENLTKIRVRMEQLEDALRTMKAPPDAGVLPHQLSMQIMSFGTNVKQLFASGCEDASISSRKKLMEIMRAFDKRIQTDTPVLVCRSASETEQLNEALELLNESSTTDLTVDQTNGHGAADSLAAKTSTKASKSSHTFTLEEISNLNKDYYQSSVPGDIELRAVEAMHLRSVESWGGTFDIFMRRIGKIVQSEVLLCVHTTFKDLKHLPIHGVIEDITTEYLQTIVQQENARLKVFCDAETKHPLSFDDVRIRAAEEGAYKKKSKLRGEKRLEVQKAVHKANGLSSKRKVKEVTVDDIGPDPWDVEVKMAAKTTAYYEVASHRFVDSICQNIFAILLPKIREGGLINHIKHHLGLDDIESNRPAIVALMTEDPERERHRQRLLNELERLKAGYKSILTVAQRLGSSRFQTICDQNTVNLDSAVFEDGYIPRSGGPSRPSPPKRRVTEADFNTSDEGEIDTPSKRPRHAPRTTGGNGGQTRLLSRARSVEVVDEDEERLCEVRKIAVLCEGD